MINHSTARRFNRSWAKPILVVAFVLLYLSSGVVAPLAQAAPDATLLAANFNSTTDGFVYIDDAFGTNQPAYASGVRTASGGYSGSGGLQVTLGGVNATLVSNGMSGGWRYTLNLASAESGVVLSFRYLLSQSATYEYDEYSRVLVQVDGVQYGRGSKNYIDHVGGDGASSQGNSSTYQPTTGWQQVELHLGDLAAGSHSITVGGYNNKKDASDETTTIVLDDVLVTSGNPAPTATAAEVLADRADFDQFLNYNRGLAQFRDRCRFSGMGCSSTDYSTNYLNALSWVESQLQGMGYTTVRHNFNYNGNTGTNLYATKLGTVTPTQMYMVTGHLDGRGGGNAFDDDGSGSALVMEVARVLSGADVTTEKSVRFIFWDKEEGGLYGSYGYASNNTANGGRRALQGTLDEPTWLGLIQHDMILYDHGAGTRTVSQSAYADMDVEWRAGSAQATASQALALRWAHGAGLYAPDYPATAYNYSTNTDDTPFHPYVASISVRENRRSLTSGSNAEWINPNYHTVNDVESSYARDDNGNGRPDDIELGYNIVRTTLGLVADLAGAHVASPNQAPVADPQTLSTPEDTALAITLAGSDPDGDPLSYAVATQPANGVLSGIAPNLIYTPFPGYVGTDSFTFTVSDGQATSLPATVSITVTPNNAPPVANPKSVLANEDTAVTIILTGSDPDGDLLTYSVASNPSQGVLSGSAPLLTYKPAANYSGPDSFTFTVSDGRATSAPAVVSITVNPVNDAPVANPQAVATACNTPLAITLTGFDIEGDPLTYHVISSPSQGSLSGAAPNLTYTPAAGFTGPDSFSFIVNDGLLPSSAAAVDILVGLCDSALPLPFVDDFEIDRGWIVNPFGTDTASSGRWERAVPQAYSQQGPKQLGDTPSGSYDLVTGARANYGGSTIRSPGIQLPAGQDITLAFQYYLAHGRNATSADYLRVRVIGTTAVTVLEVRGAQTNVDAVWMPYSVNLNAFAGQVVYLVIEAADLAKDSLIEAAVDDVSITATPPAGAPVLAANFDGGADGFVYSDDTFRGTAQPAYASGAWLAAGGYNGGGLQVSLGGIDNLIINGISGGWSQSFTLAAPAPVNISFWYKLTQSPDYDNGECSQALLAVDGVLYGSGSADYLAQICGNGNGGIEETTGWQLFSLNLGSLGAGSHTLTLGGYNNSKSYNNESSSVLIDEVRVTTP
ncbi:MAG: Aminopeptidase S [Chloroflexi bacterium ADurb.Bin222]|nr:MAG: Aminopeptidase S [Chloroflexi bacterium ADurb.Bin222]